MCTLITDAQSQSGASLERSPKDLNGTGIVREQTEAPTSTRFDQTRTPEITIDINLIVAYKVPGRIRMNEGSWS